jgi:hypothetical protein
MSGPRSSGLEDSPLVQAPERCLERFEAAHSLDDIAELRRKESRFFPLTAFLSSPQSTAGQAAPRTTPRPVLTRKASIGRHLPVSSPTPAQKAAASAACRALALRADSAPTCQPTPHAAQPSSPPPRALKSRPIPRPIMPDNPATTTPLAALLPITPSHIVSPTLSTSPVISSASSLACTPCIEPAVPLLQPPRSPPPLALRSSSTRDTAQPWAMSGLDELGPASPLTLITAPITSPYPFVTLPRPNPPSTFLAKPEPAVPFTIGLSKHDDVPLINSTAQVELQDFLKMGHATSCWCSQPSSPSCRSSSSNSPLPPQLRNQLSVFRKRKFDGPYVAPEVDTLPMSPSSTSSHFDFEDLGSTGYDLLTPSGSEEGHGSGSQEEDEWTVVTPDDDRYAKPHLISNPAHDNSNIVSPSISVLYPTPPRTPVPTPRTPSPINHPQAAGPTTTPSLVSPWTSPIHSP